MFLLTPTPTPTTLTLPPNPDPSPGKQLVFLLDFEDLGVTSLQMSEITSRFISLYPTAVVRRNPIPDPEPGLTEDSLSSKARHICICMLCMCMCMSTHVHVCVCAHEKRGAPTAHYARSSRVSPCCEPRL